MGNSIKLLNITLLFVFNPQPLNRVWNKTPDFMNTSPASEYALYPIRYPKNKEHYLNNEELVFNYKSFKKTSEEYRRKLAEVLFP